MHVLMGSALLIVIIYIIDTVKHKLATKIWQISSTDIKPNIFDIMVRMLDIDVCGCPYLDYFLNNTIILNSEIQIKVGN